MYVFCRFVRTGDDSLNLISDLPDSHKVCMDMLHPNVLTSDVKIGFVCQQTAVHNLHKDVFPQYELIDCYFQI